MKASKSILSAALLALLLTPACRSLGSGGGTGAVIGTAVGAGAGYAIGDHNDDKWAGTAIGALAGGVAGWLIGDSVEPATHERPIEGPVVHRVDHGRAPPIPDERARTVRTRPTPPQPLIQRVIIRDIYPDGHVEERVLPISELGGR